MKDYNTLLGNVEVLDARIVKASGHGQYQIVVDIVFDGERKAITAQSTDSELYDNATDPNIAIKGNSAYIMDNAPGAIESAIDNYINSL